MNQLNEPKSICTCGHTGDGPKSQHNDGPFNAGHGECLQTRRVPGGTKACDCPQFTWKAFLPGIEDKLQKGGK